MVKPKWAKLTHTSTEKALKEDDPESSTHATAKEQPVSNPNASTHPEETNPLGRSPSWTQDGFSSAVRRAGPKTDSARPFSELDQSSSANGRAGTKTDSVNGRAGPKTDSGRPFTEMDRLDLSSHRPIDSSPEIASNSFLFRLDRRHRWNSMT
ncbi:hypothetical protein F2Q69_00006598 [Brassica cretica]|uniref:Uncharacterized protein n=1 Tax=Brassica cretica TaxID=69181 RepID=A0A8S9NRV6_BRACR|nr:hypothetical protein F2Q69_00006598 [Brassica cretica]